MPDMGDEDANIVVEQQFAAPPKKKNPWFLCHHLDYAQPLGQQTLQNLNWSLEIEGLRANEITPTQRPQTIRAKVQL